MARTIRWGIIGCGDVVERKIFAALAGVDGSSVVAVMRRDAGKAESFARRHEVGFWTTDAAALIAHPDVDAVYVATPPAHHLEYARAVCDAGKPCLVEKPAGRSDEECGEMVRRFREARVPLFVSYYRRYLPKFLKVKDLIASGRLGAIVSIEYRLSKTTRDEAPGLSAERNGGGHFYDLACHVLDLFDDWFGPIEFTGGTATNVIPAHETEDAVALTFRTAGGAVGSASWNFAAAGNADELLVEGMLGRLRMRGMSKSGSIELELSPEGAIRSAGNVVERAGRQVQARLGLPIRQTFRFADPVVAHRPLIETIVAELTGTPPSVGGAGPAAAPEAALRTSALMNAALAGYYGGRTGTFWSHPERFASLRARACARTASTGAYALSNSELEFFEENGYLGPFRCDGDWRRLVVPVSKGRNLHLSEPDVFDVCTHPSVVNRAAQLMGRSRVALFKSRFVVKLPGHNAEVAWHQDVGTTNGGYYPDGRPVPTLTCWLALDRVTAENGAVKVIPGSHKRLVGDYQKKIRAELVEKGVLKSDAIAQSVTFELAPGEFYLFHSWLLHGSDANDSPGRRAGLNMRYAAVGDEYEEQFVYIPLTCAGAEARTS